MRKMDEMELSINQKGIKWSWLFTVIALFMWSIYDLVTTKSMSIPMFLLAAQYLIYFFITSVAKHKVEDENGTKQIVWYFFGLALLIVFGVILYFFSGKSS